MHFAPYFDINIAGEKQVMVTGSGKPILSLPEDAERLERYVRHFRAMQERFRSGQAGS